MYVCVCSAVTDKQIARAVDGGATTLDDLAMLLGVGTCCGMCRDETQALLRVLHAAPMASAPAGVAGPSG